MYGMQCVNTTDILLHYFLLMFVLVSNTALHDIDHGAANDCTDVISLIYTTLTLLQRCNFSTISNHDILQL